MAGRVRKGQVKEAGAQGLEPWQTESESVVLPLHHAPVVEHSVIVYAFLLVKPSSIGPLFNFCECNRFRWLYAKWQL